MRDLVFSHKASERHLDLKAQLHLQTKQEIHRDSAVGTSLELARDSVREA